ncbi:hypothetical protein AVT64_gp64 [Acinetobacter phage YMC11/12/R2315]|uniref:Uncharacterized protein n=4 Tax=Obolenskvirus TaxID=1915205 RepID=A0A0D4DC78_9CAUD|nr:hypothetical protein LD30_gp26 [Acinetobacter phage YMC-13-01-C62]YP_009203583.1 hypothetical protein AVT64_gp64 [Acinetobacter phage YMC11/12/R2315]YP_009592205.1 hypothetical protein FDG67_gp54 [Acinetobacter phage vB_AbaM-IME-AB2]AJT61436.1 hypothetical protein ABA1215_00400 [Acinetobacter phage YMC11/12/R1215]QGH74073.1 hypothetical protein BphiR2919_00038 [Acinetobacter phage Bphi-R2919]QGH74152.1 hypothetical protein BphiR1888_00037 [Acinetobacter phage Bphi-R1888]WNT46071.1 hypothet
MVTEIYTAITTSISELKKNPVKAAEHDVVCVLNRCKPAFYTVSPDKMAELLKSGKEKNDLFGDIATAYDCAISALDMVNKELQPELFHMIEQIIICCIGEDEFNKIKKSSF